MTCQQDGCIKIMKNDIFNKISPSEALEILKQIAKTDKKLKKRIIELAEELFRNVDVEAVCDEVFDALDGIDVYELWDRAGPKTDGYTSPEDMAVEMFEESLEPFLQELYRLFDLKMHQETKGSLKNKFTISGVEALAWQDTRRANSELLRATQPCGMDRRIKM